MDNLFHLKIMSREGLVFDGQIISLTSYNEKGKFDILSSHANFISLIKRGLTLRIPMPETNKSVIEKLDIKEINFDTALLRVRENNAEVYLGVEGMNRTS